MQITPATAEQQQYAQQQYTHQQQLANITQRIDNLPSCRPLWQLITLLSLGGFFELYDLFQTAYISPGLLKSGLFHPGELGVFGFSDQAAFASATFLGLFLGASCLTFFTDRYGRRLIFTVGLLWYTLATLIMLCQHDAFGIIFWRFLVGIGLGVEMVTIDAYLSELIPTPLRSPAFAYSYFIQFVSVPTLALLSWWLVPQSPLGMDGWRWVVLCSALFALAIWWIRRHLPESPRWLVQHRRYAEADRLLAQLEARCAGASTVAAQSLAPQPVAVSPVKASLVQNSVNTDSVNMDSVNTDSVNMDSAITSAPVTAVNPIPQATFSQLWQPAFRKLTFMLVVFNLFQSVGFFGFGNWLPALISGQGAALTHSLLYAFIIALAYPLGSLIFVRFAGHLENKWQIVLSSCGTALAGTLFYFQHTAVGLILFGVMITFCNAWMSFSFHCYQCEIFPTEIRARAVGFCYSFSRLSTVFSSILIGIFLQTFGNIGVFSFIVTSMLIVVLVISLLGPRTLGRRLEEISGRFPQSGQNETTI